MASDTVCISSSRCLINVLVYVQIIPNHGQFLPSFKFDCVAGIQFYLKVVFCWIFSQPTAILSEAGHTNDCLQLKLACILSGFEGDWLAWNSPEGLYNFQAINSRLPPMEKIRRWSLRLWQQNKNIIQLFCKIRLHFPLILPLFPDCLLWSKSTWNIHKTILFWDILKNASSEILKVCVNLR